MLVLVILFSIKVHSITIHSTKFATPEGLADNTVREIFQDSKGYLWFGTFDGLSRYDGYDIIKITSNNPGIPLDSQIRHIYEDKDGYLWIMGSNGLVSCYDTNKEEFIDILPDNTDLLRYFYFYEEPTGTVWLYGEDGVILVEKNNGIINSRRIHQPELGSDKVNNLAVSKDGKAFISTDKGMWIMENGDVKPLDTTRTYQWILPMENSTVLISSQGEIIKVNNRNALETIGYIENINNHSDLPAAFENNGNWYVTTSRGGGVRIDNKTLEIAPIRTDKNLANGQVIIDSNQDIWMHNNSGILHYYDKGADRLIPLRLYSENMLSLLDMERYSIARDNNNRAWIATAGNGLFIYNPSDNTLQHISTHGGNYDVLPSDRLLVASSDNHGNIWVGAENGGAAMLTFENTGATHLDLPKSSNGNQGVRSISKLPGGKIAIAGFDGNLYEYSPDLKEVKILSRDAIVYDIAIDANSNIWEATRGKGLILNGEKAEGKIPPLSFNDVFSVYADNKGRIWAGTFGSGLDVFIPRADGTGYDKRNYLNGSYAERRIRDIFEDSKGNLWVATNNGAYTFNPDNLLNGKETPKLYNLENGTLRSNEVHAIIEDNVGKIWIAEAEKGITVLDFSKGETEFIHIGIENGLSHNNVQALVLDDDYIWASTRYGLSKINQNTLDVNSFVVMPVPSENINNSGSAMLLPDRNLVFGTNQGAYIVNPDKLEIDNNNAITVTNFKVEGESFPFIPGSKGLKEKNGEYYVNLPYNENSLEFSFSTFDFSMPKQTKFRYKLEPGDVEWNSMSDGNRLGFQNLAPGEYTLMVESSRSSDKWDNTFVCHINIRSPWWATWWARLIYLVLIICGVYLLIRIFNRFTELHNKIKVEEQLTDYKLEFFTNISHEFRTPLTLIQVSLEKLHDKLLTLKTNNPGLSLSALSMPLATLDKNAKRMSRLIDELLTFRKVEKGKMVLYPEPTEMVGFLHDIFDNFKDEAHSKHLEYTFNSNVESFEMNVDRNALEKIANNLISNALKYTKEGGEVTFSIKADEANHQLKLQVIDNGVGIPDSKKHQLFTRFMQSAMSRNSIGVGLHLTFGLVELHKGKIIHSDNAGGGSVFTVTLPSDMAASEHKHDEGIGRPSFDLIFRDEIMADTEELTVKEKTKNLLIIDDDADIRNFLSQEFSRYFMILMASDGQTGLEVARNNEVHMIICDVMMPDMSGYEVTRLLKEDFATSHIPIIQLTALSNDDCQLEGITSGADAYITKPFNLKYLMTRVAKLIEQRENLFAKYSANPTLALPELPMGDKDKEFADKLSQIAEKNLDNSEYSVDDFASDMAMGRTIFFRKVKGVTGYSPKEYLRVLRMKKAAELLLTTDLTITEITYKVGISDPAYFNKCFKAQFGKAPSVYQKENTSQSNS